MNPSEAGSLVSPKMSPSRIEAFRTNICRDEIFESVGEAAFYDKFNHCRLLSLFSNSILKFYY